MTCAYGCICAQAPTLLVIVFQEGVFWCGRGICRLFSMVQVESLFFILGFNVGCSRGMWVGRVSDEETRESKVMGEVARGGYREPRRVI